MENQTNGTTVGDPTSTYVVLGLYGVLDIAILVANSLVLFLVYEKRYLRTVTNNFLVSLAVSDLSTGLFAIPSCIACTVTLTQGSSCASTVCITMDICIRFIAFSSVVHLTVLTVERYLRITKPFAYRSRVTGTSTYRIICGIWAFSLFASLVQLSWIPNLQADIIYGFVSFAIVVVIPLFLISGIYIAMFRFIRRHKAKRDEVLAMSMSKNDDTNKKANDKNEMKLLMVFLAMIVVFILGSVNYFFWTVLFDLEHFQSIRLSNNTYGIITTFTMFFRYFSSLCNPMLLTFFKQDFYEALMSAMGRRQRTRKKRTTTQDAAFGKTTSDVL